LNAKKVMEVGEQNGKTYTEEEKQRRLELEKKVNSFYKLVFG